MTRKSILEIVHTPKGSKEHDRKLGIYFNLHCVQSQRKFMYFMGAVSWKLFVLAMTSIGL